MLSGRAQRRWLRPGAIRVHLDGIRRDRGDFLARELIYVAARDRGEAGGAAVACKRVNGDDVGTSRHHASVVGRRGVFEAGGRLSTGLPDSIGPLQDHVAHNRPADILGEIAERLVEPMLGERTGDSARTRTST